MNKIFASFLRKFVLVFFDDILIYSKSEAEHADHLKVVLQILKENQLTAKRRKCDFAVSHVEYLGHLISSTGVATNPAKIKDMQSWPLPTTIKQLRGFLGLTGYYRRFIKDYGIICKPLHELLKNRLFSLDRGAYNCFQYSEAQNVFCSCSSSPQFPVTIHS
jgi:hypothetical protein